MTDNYCVIMAGGIGSRFWPFSREHLPKQFLDFFGTGRTLLQMTFDRFRKIMPLSNIFVVTNERYAALVREQLPELDEAQILLEPARRNTAPCIAYATYHIKARNPKANMVVAPCDHLILREDAFLQDVQKSLAFVKEHKALVTLGIKPPRDGLRLYPEQRHDERRVHQGQDFHRKAELRPRQGLLRERRVLLELRYLHLERGHHPPGAGEIPAGHHRPLRHRPGPLQHRRGAGLHPRAFPLLPKHFHRLRGDGKGRECLYVVRRFRLGRPRYLGLALRHRRQGCRGQRRPEEQGHPLRVRRQHDCPQRP